MRNFLLAISLLLVVVIPLTACSESEKYYCQYYIGDICADQADNLAYLEFELDKDEVLSGKISVYETFARVKFFYSDPDPLHVFEAAQDPVIITMMKEYTFSLKAKQPTRLRCYFYFTGWPAVLGDFRCNIPPVKTWVAKSAPSWTGPRMVSP